MKNMACLSLSLNVPGFPKSNPTVNTFFGYCLRDMKYTLMAHNINIIKNEEIEICDAAGDFYLVACSPGINLATVKQVCESFEKDHPLGRFIDADLNDYHGNSVSSGKSKLCFFCLERPAIECRREKAHDYEELRSFMFPKMTDYCLWQREVDVIKKCSSLAQKAILQEISLTPKPGLVDKYNSGSHNDMNFQTFLDSTAAISPWFGELIHEGFCFRNDDFTTALPLIRSIGLRMESAMFEATQNVNTQKGIIFLMGLSLFACGKLFRQNDNFINDEFRYIIKGICRDMVKQELIESVQGKSHGGDIFLKYGLGGARGEAESGFEMVFEYGLPQLLKIESLNNEVLIKCFLSIAANNNDTNILYRSNAKVLSNFKMHCKNALDNFNDQNYSAVIDFCKNENISPGGSADLLAVTIFVWSLKRSFASRH